MLAVAFCLLMDDDDDIALLVVIIAWSAQDVSNGWLSSWIWNLVEGECKVSRFHA
jgi:hypothetical protein